MKTGRESAVGFETSIIYSRSRDTYVQASLNQAARQAAGLMNSGLLAVRAL